MKGTETGIHLQVCTLVELKNIKASREQKLVECLGGHSMAFPGGKDAQHQPTNLLSMMEGDWLYDQVHRPIQAYFFLCPCGFYVL